jgi:hypothetical protein
MEQLPDQPISPKFTGIALRRVELSPEVVEAREALVDGAAALLAEINDSKVEQTSDGRPIHRNSTGRTETDRVATGTGIEMVAHEYGKPGLHVGDENNRPLARLVEVDGSTLSVTTVFAEDPVAAMVRGGEYELGKGADVVSDVGYERFDSDGHELVTTESWQLTVRGDGYAHTRVYPVPTEPRMGGVGGGRADLADFEHAQNLLNEVRQVAFGAAEQP